MVVARRVRGVPVVSEPDVVLELDAGTTLRLTPALLLVLPLRTGVPVSLFRTGERPRVGVVVLGLLPSTDCTLLLLPPVARA